MVRNWLGSNTPSRKGLDLWCEYAPLESISGSVSGAGYSDCSKDHPNLVLELLSESSNLSSLARGKSAIRVGDGVGVMTYPLLGLSCLSILDGVSRIIFPIDGKAGGESGLTPRLRMVSLGTFCARSSLSSSAMHCSS